MAKRQKPKAERDRVARWEQIVSTYQRRHRQWVMDSMPRMNNADWDTYTRWVAGFGAMSLNQAYRNSRKMRRRLTAAKNVTVTVRSMAVPFTACPRQMQLVKDYGVGKMKFTQLARAAGKTAKVRRATRR